MKQLRYIALILLGVFSSQLLLADDYNPTSPAEPYLNNKVTVTANPSHAVSWLSGAGHYVEGATVNLNSSAYSNLYVFTHWTKDGEWYSDKQWTTYTMGADAVTFTAHYEYTPVSPDEPKFKDCRLYLVAEPPTACSINLTSGERYAYGQTITVNAWKNDNYEFFGWYEGGKLVSENLNFSFIMPNTDVALTARFEYSPANPAEPEQDFDNPQTDVQFNPTGDGNNDGTINVTDAVYIIRVCLGLSEASSRGMCDVNSDGKITVTDAVDVIRRCLKKY